MEKEEQMLKKRFIDLSRTAYERGYVTFTDFLNLNELNILHTMPKGDFYTGVHLFGGYALAERQMVAFLPDALCYEYVYPFCPIRITPLNKRFAETLGHRDYLGALLNLGIERCKLGDILVFEDSAIVFACDALSSFICEELTRIRHTAVMAQVEEMSSFSYEPDYETVRGTVASVRLDSLLSLAFSSSRSKLSGLIEGQKVYVNGKLTVSNGYRVKESDIISVRGMGKFRYIGLISETKKGRYYVEIQKYI